MKRLSGSEVKDQGHSEVKNIKQTTMLTVSEERQHVFIDCMSSRAEESFSHVCFNYVTLIKI